MHISEGVLSAPVLAAGAALTVAGTAMGLRRLDPRDMPRAGVMAAGLFVVSMIRVPILFTPVYGHLLLNGLAGLVLGWAVFPAFLVALFLRAILLGGLTTLGVNTLTMALPGIVVCFLFGWLLRRGQAVRAASAFAAGALAVLLAGLLDAVVLYLSGPEFAGAGAVIVAVHLPIMIVEGLVCMMCVAFLTKVRPSMLSQSGKPEASNGA